LSQGRTDLRPIGSGPTSGCGPAHPAATSEQDAVRPGITRDFPKLQRLRDDRFLRQWEVGTEGPLRLDPEPFTFRDGRHHTRPVAERASQVVLREDANRRPVRSHRNQRLAPGLGAFAGPVIALARTDRDGVGRLYCDVPGLGW